MVKALTMTFALIFLKGTASGNLLDAHMMVIKYWCPDLFLGRDCEAPVPVKILIGMELDVSVDNDIEPWWIKG